MASARPFLDNPRRDLHAAAGLGVDVRYLPQSVRVRPNDWLGFTFLHPEAKPLKTVQQLDHQPSAAWDRPQAA